MSVILDPRDGSSADTEKQFSVFAAKVIPTWGVKVKVRHLESGDAAWTGYCGPEDHLRRVGVERKTVSDLMSSWRSGRLVDQVGKMIEQYPERYLVIEGPRRADPTTGTLQVALGTVCGENPSFGGRWVAQGHGARRGLWADLQGYLQTIRRQGGVTIIDTLSMIETAMLLVALYRWYAKTWDEHKSLLPVLKRINGQQVDSGEIGVLRKMSVQRKMIAQVPSLGWERSALIERAFGGLQFAAEAPLSQWMAVPGIGPVIAHAAREELRRALRGDTHDYRADPVPSRHRRPRRASPRAAQ